jgi:glycosyltransferase involved in cell wall biosynthesis
VRKLPSTLDPYVQDLWAYLHLGGLARRHYDLGIFGNPDNVLLAWLLKRRGIVETLVYDDWDYYAGFEAPPHWRLPMAWRERFCISIADTVISVGHLLAEQRVEQGAKRAVVVPNGVDYPLFALGQQKRPHPPTLIYMGSIEDWTGLGVAVEGFAHVHSRIPLARFLILGPDGNPYGRALRERVGELGLAEHVLFLGYKPYHELPEFLAEADIGVALFAPSELTRYAFPLKVVEYMAAGLPVLGTRAGETGRAIRESGAGEALDCSAEAFACAAVELLGDPMRLAEYGKRGREYARGYDWEALFPRFHEAVGLGNSQGPSKE